MTSFGVELGFSVFWVGGHFNLSDYFAVVVVARTELHSLHYQLNFGLLESSTGHFRACRGPLMACGLPHEKLRYRVSINYISTQCTVILHHYLYQKGVKSLNLLQTSEGCPSAYHVFV